MKRIKKMLVVFLSVMMIMTNLTSIHGEEETIRVGVFHLGNFQGIDQDGEAEGYNIDYLTRISEVTHCKYEFVECQNWVEATNLLETGKIDLLAPAQITDALSTRFLYSNYQMGIEFGAIYCLKDRDDLIYEDYNAMNKLTFGGVAESSFTDHFKIYSEKNGFTPKIKTYNNTTELFAALNNKEVDCIVTNIMFATENVKTLGRYNPTPVYYIAAKGNEKLISKIDNALYNIQLNDPTFQADLMNQYFPQYTNTQFSYNEYSFVDSLPKIKVGYVSNQAPISYQADDGSFKGIDRNIFNRISKISGIQFEYVALPEGKVTYEYLKEHQIYLVTNVENNHTNRNNSYMRLSKPYMTSQLVLVSKSTDNFSDKKKLKLAMVTGSGSLPTILKEKYPNFELVNYETPKQCFEAVKNDEANILLQNRYVVDLYISNPRYQDMSIMPIDTIDNQYCFGVMDYRDGSEMLNYLLDDRFISVINKSIGQLTETELNNWIISNTAATTYKYTIGDFAYQYRYFLVVFFALMIVIYLLILRNKKNEELKNIELAGKNKELGLAVEQAHEASRAKSLFLSRMSHEIRTPMNAIVGLTTITRHHLDNPYKVEDNLNKIDSSSKILLNIINDVLDMSAIESEKLKIAHAPFDFKELLLAVSNVYYPQCKNKGIDFEMNSGSLSEEILIGDSLRVNQILLNLISNAYKFTDKGGRITVDIAQKSIRKNIVFIEMKVQDTGCGMSEDMMSRLFQSFEQESSSTAKKHGGSGLGLSIAKSLIDLMQGTIDVESTKGVGTTFTVNLPFELSDNHKRIDPEKIENIHALVVDDDEHAREYTAIVLERLKVKYDIACNGEEAIEKINYAFEHHQKYDIAFIDWKMPGLSGIDITKKIRKIFNEDTIIIIVSAYDLSEVEDEARSAGANMFISKPLFQSSVFNVLMTLTDGKYIEDKQDADEFDFHGARVLLAEDNEMNTEIAIDLLTMVNLKVDHATDGQEALAMFEASGEGAYDIILMDIQMPNMDGYEATNLIRKLNRQDAMTIPIYAMTADAFNEDVSRALNAGMNGHISKPIDTNILYKTIAKALKKS